MPNEPESVEALLRGLEQEQIAQADYPDSHGRKHPSIIRELERINRVPTPETPSVPPDLTIVMDTLNEYAPEDPYAPVEWWDVEHLYQEKSE